MTAETAAPENQNTLIPEQSELDLIKQINAAIASNTTASDIRISRIAIQQPLSPEAAAQTAGYEQGMIFDNLTREVLSVKASPPWLLEKGVKPENAQPLHYCLMAWNFKLPSEYIKWIPRDDQVPGGNRWEFKTLEPKDPRVVEGVWKSHGGTYEGKKPPVTINTNYLGLVIDPDLKIPNGYFRVATFARSSAGCGSTLASILQAHRLQNQKPWDRCYYLYTALKTVPKPHYVFQLARGPLLKEVAEPFVAEQCLAMGKSLVGPNGPLFQTMLINAASLDADDSHDDHEVSSGNQQSASDDPFVDPDKKGEASF
jgi:hypothetical protein